MADQVKEYSFPITMSTTRPVTFTVENVVMITGADIVNVRNSFTHIKLDAVVLVGGITETRSFRIYTNAVNFVESKSDLTHIGSVFWGPKNMPLHVFEITGP